MIVPTPPSATRGQQLSVPGDGGPDAGQEDGVREHGAPVRGVSIFSPIQLPLTSNEGSSIQPTFAA